MKKAIIDTLESKGSLSEKKLKKGAFKVLGEADSDEVEFSSVLAKLVAKGKIALADGEYALSSATETTESTKRKRSNSETKVEEETVAKKAAPEKSAKTVKKPAAVEGGDGKVMKMEELWKNGEKYWREGSFHPDYLRTNPEK